MKFQNYALIDSSSHKNNQNSGADIFFTEVDKKNFLQCFDEHLEFQKPNSIVLIEYLLIYSLFSHHFQTPTVDKKLLFYENITKNKYSKIILPSKI